MELSKFFWVRLFVISMTQKNIWVVTEPATSMLCFYWITFYFAMLTTKKLLWEIILFIRLVLEEKRWSSKITTIYFWTACLRYDLVNGAKSRIGNIHRTQVCNRSYEVAHHEIWQSGAIYKFSTIIASAILSLVTSCEKLLGQKTSPAPDWQKRTNIVASGVTRCDLSRILLVRLSEWL